TSQVDCIRLAAICSLALGLFCFALPHTPPRREGADPLAFARAFRLLKDPDVLVFMLVSFVVATELMFYYVLTAPFLQDLGVSPANTSSVMIIAQGAEAVVMALLLPYVLPRWGVRKVMVIGILAWPIRYAIFAWAGHAGGAWLPLVEASLTLHGFCYVFFFVVGFIYIDSAAPKDIRHSAQSLYGVITMGLGLALGSTLAGWLQDHFTEARPLRGGPPLVHWGQLFLVPCVLTVICAIVFPILFKDRRASGVPGDTTLVGGRLPADETTVQAPK
ncbi:MAG: MFS transporter, partial [Chloroflexi bacterium]|nr:MFS transporter [Chloroflexota bacterium]